MYRHTANNACQILDFSLTGRASVVSSRTASKPEYELSRSFQFQMLLDLVQFKYVDKLLALPAKDDHLPPPCICRAISPITSFSNEGGRGISKKKKGKTKKVEGFL